MNKMNDKEKPLLMKKKQNVHVHVEHTLFSQCFCWSVLFCFNVYSDLSPSVPCFIYAKW